MTQFPGACARLASIFPECPRAVKVPPLRSCNMNVNPPAVPRPGIAGGPKAKAIVSGISLLIFWFRAPHQPSSGKFIGVALFPRIKLKEVKASVGGGCVGKQAEAGDRSETLNAVSVRQYVIHLAHDCVSTLQRGSIRKLQSERRHSPDLLRG